LLDRGLVAGRAFWFYLYKLCWPLNLVFIYPRWQINHRLWWQYLFPLAAGLLAAGLWGVRHRSRAPSAALLFFAGTLFPALGFLNVYPFRYSYVADHFQYLASLGMIVLISAGAAIWWRGLARRPAWGGAMTCVAFLATLAILTWHQSGIYADQETLWTDTLKKDPNTWIAHNNLGTALQERNDLVGAEEHFLEALALHPRYDEALANLGMARARQGKITEAIDCLRRALEISPAKFPIRMSLANALCEAGQLEAARSEFLHVLQTKPDQADAHLSLAALYLKQGNTVESLRHEKEAMRLKPESVPVQAYEELAARLFQQQDFKEAAFYYAQAAKLKPDDARTQASLGICLAITKEYQKALPCLRQAVRLDPQNPSALNELAWILATAPDPKARDGPEAVRLAKQACALTQERSPHLLGTLDAAYAEAGQFPEAIQTAEKVRQLCLSQGETELAQQAEQRLAAYRAGKPWRGP
jgi:tetratricopeptide (TPR) repeat protein